MALYAALSDAHNQIHNLRLTKKEAKIRTVAEKAEAAAYEEDRRENEAAQERDRRRSVMPLTSQAVAAVHASAKVSGATGGSTMAASKPRGRGTETSTLTSGTGQCVAAAGPLAASLFALPE